MKKKVIVSLVNMILKIRNLKLCFQPESTSIRKIIMIGLYKVPQKLPIKKFLSKKLKARSILLDLLSTQWNLEMKVGQIHLKK